MSTKTDTTDSTAAAASAGAGAAHAVSITGWQRLLVWPLGVLARLWTASLRFDLSAESLRALTKKDVPVTFILWHNRLFIAGEVYKRYRAGRMLHGLVSASKDGAWLAAFFDILGVGCVRGSSSFNARESVRLLVGAMQAGHDTGITPDGPRGPMYDFKGGGVIVARRARAPLLLFGAQFSNAWRLRSWDRFYLPRPFSRVTLNCVVIPPEAIANRPESMETLARRLREINPDPPGETTTGGVA